MEQPVVAYVMATDLLGRRESALPKSGWIGDGGEPQLCIGAIRAVALDRGFIFIIEEDDGRLRNVWTLTHEIQLVL